MSEEQANEVSIEDLELSLQVYEIEAEQKLKKLQVFFTEKQTVDLTKMFYEERSSLQIKFQNIVSDLTEFLIKQEIASTDKLRKTFYLILENPLTFLFKVSRFEIFNLRLNAFDIELEPIDAVAELATAILRNIEKHTQLTYNLTQRYNGGEYTSFQQFLEEAQINLIQDQIFLFYSYLRKGGKFIKKEFEHKVRVVELYSKIEEKLLKQSIQRTDVKTLKQLSVLNYQIYLLQSSYDVLCFYLKVPLKAVFAEVFKQLQTLGQKARKNSNYDLFILIFLRYSKEILGKLSAEGVDPVFKQYIEQALMGLLELWGCRLCYYQQFFDLFCQLLSLHPAPAEALLLCLQFNPTLQKDDIVLLRTNFKHDLQQKQSELLSLLKPKSMQEINTSLSQYYHRTLYNLDFAQYSRQQLLELINLVNGNASVGQFFSVAERAFREWNHTIDLTNPHKFIYGEFKYPTLQQSKIIESLRLLNNLCILQTKEVKQYEQLVKAGSIQKAFIGFSSFLFNNPQARVLTSAQLLPKLFLTNVLKFLKKTIISSVDWETACLLFSEQLSSLGLPHIADAIITIRDIVQENYHAFSVKKLVKIFKNVIALEQQFKLDSSSSLEHFLNSFLAGTQKQNEQIRFFRFFDSKISQINKITSTEQAFLKKYACINGDIIEPRENGCFILSELEIITNPIQFDKVIDNYYFNLDNNAKKFIQSLCIDWQLATTEIQLTANISIVSQLINRYPIAIPLLCSTRVITGTTSKRFIQLLTANINRQSFGLLRSIIECRNIRFKNGRDYIRQEILPVILKQTLKVINQGTQRMQHFELLALTLTYSKTHEVKMDLIQNSIETIKYQISQSNNEDEAYRLSQAIYLILTKYFQKKQVEMRKKGLVSIFHQQVWSQMRTKTVPLQNQNNKKQLQKVKIPDQIMITPYIVSPQFETEEGRLEKLKSTSIDKKLEIAEIELASLKLPNKAASANVFLEKKAETQTTIDLTKLKYNIQSHLGLQIKTFCRKEGFKIITSSPQIVESAENNDQNITLVQYYLKQFQNPQINAELVLKYLLGLINKKVAFCSLFSNYSNLQKLFSSLILLLAYFSKNVIAPTANDTIQQKLLFTGSSNKTDSIKTILNIFSEIGYTNLWAESFNSLKNVDYLKQLKIKTQFKEEDQEQTFFSWMLKVTLQNSNVKEELNLLLEKIFTTRPKQQNSLMYKVTINRGLLNLIMQSLEIHNLSYVSLLFHSNYNNLRLYTDQLHEGLKALNMASKNRAYNQYIQLSKDIEDEEFYIPLKLFKQNFQFFIRIEKEGYRFKRNEQQKLGRQRVLKVLRSGVSGQQLNKQIEQVVQDFQVQLDKLQYNIASRVKSFYLVTKLRDLSYQNSITVCLLHQILLDNKVSKELLLQQINKVQIFSLMMSLYNKLVRFDKPQNCENFLLLDRCITQKEVNICSMRRYSFAMNKIYDKCQLEFDEVLQRSIDALKSFLASKQGSQWINSINVYPPFLNKSFVSFTSSDTLVSTIRTKVLHNLQNFNSIQLSAEPDSFSNLVKNLRQLKKSQLLSKDKVKVKFNGKILSLSDFLPLLQTHLVSSQTFRKSKDGYWLFNRYKTSQKTLEEIQLLGMLVGYCLFNEIQMDLPLHSSLLSAVGFGICDLQDLLQVDFKVWQDLRNVMSATDSKDLNLNFSYLFESLETLKQERVELLDKGTSKKVNNLNRQDYCDLVCCYLLYKTVSKQVFRFLEGIVYLCPKELVSSLRVSELHNFFLKRNQDYSQAIIKRLMRKRGLVLPQSILVGGKRVQNLKDYQSIQWLYEIIEENAQLRDKLWPYQSNLVLCTWIGQEVLFQPEIRRLLVGRVTSKQDLKQALLRFK